MKRSIFVLLILVTLVATIDVLRARGCARRPAGRATRRG